MAMQSVPTTSPAPYCLPHDHVDRASELLHMTRAIVDLMASAGVSDNVPEDDSIPMAAHAVNGMLKELQAIAELRVELEG